MSKGQFPTTQWHLVRIAGEGFSEESKEALAALCRTYWYPLYSFVRRQGYSPEEAQDLTQGFFMRLLEKHYLRDYQRERGRFRSFLLASLKHFLANERDWAAAQKRGGGIAALPLDAIRETGETRYNLEPRSTATPEKIFERQWALALLDHVLRRLQTEFTAAGKDGQFDRLKGFLVGDESHIPYRLLAADLGTSEGALKISIHRLRRRFREVLREEIAPTVSHTDEVQEEIRYLMAVVAAPL
jgi:DNA-directed RNA polymerase specialized sigma24 family protein